MRRIAVVASHPIQYQAPWFRALARVCDLTVFFCHRQDAQGQARAGFDTPFEWDVPLLHGYRYEWLENVSGTPGVDRFGGCDTPGIRARLAEGRFEACIVSGWYLKSYLQAIRACRGLGVPVIVRGDSQLKGTRSRVFSLAKHLPYRWLLQRIDAHLFVGKANYAYLRHFGVRPERLFFAPHFVENDRFAADAARARQSGAARTLRERWGANESTAVFLFVGKFIAKKRPADFIAAVARLAGEGEDVRGVLVGSGPEDTALRAQAAAVGGPIAFDGFQNQTHIASRYAAADCLVLPSDGRETWGLVVNEAMATGLPAVVSDAVGCGPDLIQERRTGFTYPVGNVALLAARMRSAMSLRGARAPGAREAILAQVGRYSCDAAVSGTVAALQALGLGRPELDAAAKAQHA
jgi:glycosyltransferase involved in cell wall biosynthesis